MSRKILSISSAPGWSAELRSDEPGEEDGRVHLVGWALVEGDDGEREVIGLMLHRHSDEAPTGWVGLVDEAPAFVGYAFAGVRMQPH